MRMESTMSKCNACMITSESFCYGDFFERWWSCKKDMSHFFSAEYTVIYLWYQKRMPFYLSTPLTDLVSQFEIFNFRKSLLNLCYLLLINLSSLQQTFNSILNLFLGFFRPPFTPLFFSPFNDRLCNINLRNKYQMNHT